MNHPPIVSEPSFCNSVGTEDSESDRKKMSMSKIFGRMKEGAMNILRCGDVNNVEDVIMPKKVDDV